ncbi:MAG: type IV pilus assembly protein PilW [Candidatus Endobugula sp.]
MNTLIGTQRRYLSLKACQSGLSLVELMISITLGLLIMVGVLQLYATSNVNARTSQGASRIQENIRYAMTRIGDDIAQAGNIKCAKGTAITGMLGAGNADGVTVGNWDDFDDSYVSGIDNTDDGDDPLTDADRLIVKYVDYSEPYTIANAAATTINLAPAPAPAITLAAGDTVAAGNCRRMAIFVTAAAVVNGTTVTSPANHALDLTNASGFLYAGNTGAYTYSIGNSASGACAVGTLENCSLYRGKNGVFPGDELVQGVHGLQVMYGTEAGGTVGYVVAPAPPASFKSVDRVQVTLTFNGVDGALSLDKQVTRVFAIRTAW